MLILSVCHSTFCSAFCLSEYNDVHLLVCECVIVSIIYGCKLCAQIRRRNGLCQCQTSNCGCKREINLGRVYLIVLVGVFVFVCLLVASTHLLYFDSDIIRRFSMADISAGFFFGTISISHFLRNEQSFHHSHMWHRSTVQCAVVHQSTLRRPNYVRRRQYNSLFSK